MEDERKELEMRFFKAVIATVILAVSLGSLSGCASTNYATKEECEEREVNCPTCPSGRQCIQLSNGSWHAE
jgi:hypothetical protein